MKLSTLIFLLGILCQSMFSKNIIESSPSHNHVHAREEIGLALSPIYNLGEDEWVYGMHIHYLYHVFLNPKYAIGMGYEHLFDEHGHDFFGIIGSYTPIDHLVLSITPGLAFEGGEHKHTDFGCHFEVLYEFAISKFHIGPAFEVAYEPNGSHIGLGVHLGYGF